jgi:hypothetical protein
MSQDSTQTHLMEPTLPFPREEDADAMFEQMEYLGDATADPVRFVTSSESNSPEPLSPPVSVYHSPLHSPIRTSEPYDYKTPATSRVLKRMNDQRLSTWASLFLDKEPDQLKREVIDFLRDPVHEDERRNLKNWELKQLNEYMSPTLLTATAKKRMRAELIGKANEIAKATLAPQQAQSSPIDLTDSMEAAADSGSESDTEASIVAPIRSRPVPAVAVARPHVPVAPAALNSVTPLLVFYDSEVTHSGSQAPVCQIAAISFDASVVFNRYIRSGYLAQQWMNYSALVHIDPWDDEAQSEPFLQTMDAFCDTFPEGTVFLQYGVADYAWLVNAFYANQEKMPLYEHVVTRFEGRRYVFVDARPWIHSIGVDLSLDELLQFGSKGASTGTQEALYGKMFSKLLLYHVEARMFLYSRSIKTMLDRRTDRVTISDLDDRDRPADGSWKVVFWTNKDMKPLNHYAHTDALMLRDIVLTLALFRDTGGQEMADDRLEAEAGFMDFLTGLTVNFRFFRDARILLKPGTVDTDKLTSEALGLAGNAEWRSQGIRGQVITNLPPRANRLLDPIVVNRDKSKRLNSVDAVWSPLSRHFAAAAAGIKDDKIDAGRRVVEVALGIGGLKVKLAAQSSTDSETRKDVMRNIILEADLRLEGTSSEFLADPFASILGAANLIDPDDPCLVVLSQFDRTFPNTMVLHTRRCVTLRDPLDNDQIRPAFKASSVYAVDLKSGKKSDLPAIFKYCKQCKEYVIRPTRINGMVEPMASTRSQSQISQNPSQTQSHHTQDVDADIERSRDQMLADQLTRQQNVAPIPLPPQGASTEQLAQMITVQQLSDLMHRRTSGGQKAMASNAAGALRPPLVSKPVYSKVKKKTI